MDISGKTAIVTGASQGIGEAIALDLAQNGAQILLVDIQKEKLDAVAQKIEAIERKAFSYTADVSDMRQVEGLVEKMIQDHGKIHHLVNNAGITRDNLLMRMKEEEWDTVMAVNLKGVFNFSKAVIRHMIRNRYGRIVNISSVVGLIGNPGQTNYSASKAGVLGLTKSLAREVASRGITVNAVAPGFIETAMTERLPEEVQKQFLDVIPMGRFGTAREVAQAVRFLISDEASYLSGQVINVNGGLFM
jgi:3-oxoacyl-[acyl-carrier protein] reductase